MADVDRHDASPKSYLIGFALALLLTAIPFLLVWRELLTGDALFAAIAMAGLAQTVVHLRSFLHIGLRTTSRETLHSLAFAIVLITIMIGGSLVIMMDLNERMTF